MNAVFGCTLACVVGSFGDRWSTISIKPTGGRLGGELYAEKGASVEEIALKVLELVDDKGAGAVEVSGGGLRWGVIDFIKEMIREETIYADDVEIIDAGHAE